MSSQPKVPSVYSYSQCTSAQEQQWGASLSPNAIAMINTKLELDVQESKSAELGLILQALDGMNDLRFEHIRLIRGYPEYTWKRAEDIIADYLTKVCEYVLQAVAGFGPDIEAQKMPVDLVITVPVV
jgi:hypothetical protein